MNIRNQIGKNFSYNEKAVFLDTKIERDILFFKNNYADKRKEYYALRRQVREKIKHIEEKEKQKIELKK